MADIRGTISDVAKLAVTVGLGALAAVTPRTAHGRLVDALAAAGRRVRSDELDDVAATLVEYLPNTTLQERRQVAVEMRTMRIEHGICRGYGIFRSGWPAQIEVTGAEHLDAAQRQGRGVVLWLMSFLDATPLNLAALSLGYPVTHLSAAHHGVQARSVVSQRVIAPILLRGERRSQSHRVVIPPDGGLTYLRELKSTIERDRGTVTIRGDYPFGRRMVEAPCLGSTVAFPTGAPSLAHGSGAPLLTTAVVRRSRLVHEVQFDEPIQAARRLDRSAFQHAAVQEFAARLEQRTRRHPGSLQWLRVRRA